jgi:heavy metal sensor kinase
VIKPLSLRVRLTGWYFGVVALSFLLISVVALYGMDRSIQGAVDNALGERANAVHSLITRQISSRSLADLKRELREHSGLSSADELMQIADAQGNWLYRSRSLVSHEIPLPHEERPTIYTDRFAGLVLRVRSEWVSVGGQRFSLQVAAPMHEFREAVEHFRSLLIVAVPFLLICATAGGYFLSRRALAPVQRIIDATDKIGATNLSSRLVVPGTGDELQRLSETLNNMLSRIEGAFQRVAQFTADASHELRTPLAILRTRTELALRRPRSEGEYREVLGQLLHGLERGSVLVERLMLLARADSGDPILQHERVQLDVILRSVCEQGATLAAAKNLRFQAQLSPQDMPIEGDVDFLERLFLILIDNAIKYTAPEGEIVLSTQVEGSAVVVSVSDSGIGISEADLPHVFERFYRVDKARSRESGGAGLGLAIGRWIAQAHHGDIGVESSLGKGTVFRVRLPLCTAADRLAGG